MEKTPFFKKTWFIVMMLWIVPPIGIALMLTCKKEWKKAVRIIISVIFGIWFILWCALLLSPSDSTSADNDSPDEETTTVEESATHLPDYTTDTATTESSATTEKETTTPNTTKVSATASPTTTKAPVTTTKPTTTKAPTTIDPESQITVYITKTGEKYHYENPCGSGTYSPISLADAKARGYGACEKCVLH